MCGGSTYYYKQIHTWSRSGLCRYNSNLNREMKEAGKVSPLLHGQESQCKQESEAVSASGD